MKDLTAGCQAKTFRQIYKELPSKGVITPPKKAFILRIAGLTKKSTQTVRCWLAGAQRPDALTRSIIEKELNIPSEILFPDEER